jgi:holdfast attachment protein HfaA
LRPSMSLPTPAAASRLVFLTLAAASLAGGAAAQNMNSNSASYNAGYGRVAGQENHPVDVSTRDANGNRVILDGIIQTGVDQSTFASAGAAAGAWDSFSGVGAGGGSTAIGNNLVVITQGNYNTVIVNSQQTNNGNVSAGSSLNGGVSNGQ